MIYKPCTAAQYRVMEYLREAFDPSLCLIYPSRPNALVLEDPFGEKLGFFFRDGKVLEHPLMPPANPAASRRKNFILCYYDLFEVAEHRYVTIL